MASSLFKVFQKNGKTPSSPRLSHSMMMVSVDANNQADLCILQHQDGKAGDSKHITFMLDGSVSLKKIKKILRDLQWRSQRGQSSFVVVPSEDVFLMVEEFPSTDLKEVHAMAEGIMQSLVELESEEHTLSTSILHRGTSSTLCAIAIFQKERIERVFKGVQKLGVTTPRFIVDVLADWIVSRENSDHGFWGVVMKGENGRAIVKALKVTEGVVQAIRQRFYFCSETNASWLKKVGNDLFPEELRDQDLSSSNRPAIQWHLIEKANPVSQQLESYSQQEVAGKLISFELQPKFWKQHLERQSKRRRWLTAAWLFSGVYGLGISILTIFSIWFSYQEDDYAKRKTNQEPAYIEAKQIEKDLAAVQASQSPTGNPLELLVEIDKPRPPEVTFTKFDYVFQGELKLMGIATRKEAALDYIQELRKNPSIKTMSVPEGDIKPDRSYHWRVGMKLQKGASL